MNIYFSSNLYVLTRLISNQIFTTATFFNSENIVSTLVLKCDDLG
jgi:hypothetical protein